MQRGFTSIYLVVGLLVFVLVAGGAYWLRTVKNQNNSLVQQTVTNQTKPQSSPIPTPIQTDTIPQENTVYLGTYREIETIFITNKELGKYF